MPRARGGLSHYSNSNENRKPCEQSVLFNGIADGESAGADGRGRALGERVDRHLADHGRSRDAQVFPA